MARAIRERRRPPKVIALREGGRPCGKAESIPEFRKSYGQPPSAERLLSPSRCPSSEHLRNFQNSAAFY
jgi:hypothetical protein